MPRTLLLCFIHGFKGNDDTFRNFPRDLKYEVSRKLPDHNVESVVYPKYETKGELGQCTESFLGWLKERVMEVRKSSSENPWPPRDRDVGVILVAHSMGGFVASDTLFIILNERIAHGQESSPIFPLIQGILTFDTPYNGLARSMFVYGAFSNYQKVSTVFNAMTALSAAPAGLSKMAFKQPASALATASKGSSPAWKGWQLVAVRTGTVGAIAAGGVLAYMHRQEIMDGMRSMRNLNKESVKEGYQQSIDALGQGLAYINRGNVGRSFEYLSDHFTFVGTLMKQQELSRRLERLAALRGIGIHDFYTSLGENGYWKGGYFVPERNFVAVPAKDHPAHHLFSRQVIRKIDDEVQAHVSMFQPEKNESYYAMTEDASELVVKWFNDDSDIVDDPKFAEAPAPEAIEQPVSVDQNGDEVPKADEATVQSSLDEEHGQGDNDSIPDESPLDIAAAASLVPLPDDADDAPDGIAPKESPKSSYMRHLMAIAQQAGDFKSYVPTKMPQMPQIPSGASFKSFVPSQLPQIPSFTTPTIPNFGSVNVFGKKNASDEVHDEKKASSAEEKTEETSAVPPDSEQANVPETETGPEKEKGTPVTAPEA